MALVQSQDANLQSSLSDMFANPEHSDSCARCILGASTKGILQGQQTVGSKAFWNNLTQDLEYWRSQMRFLFAIRTEDQTRTMLSRLNRCSCKMKDRRIVDYHRIGRSIEADLFSRTCVEGQTSAMYLITSLFCNLSYVLDLSHIRSVAKRTNTKWPTCPEDLMPFGAENLVQSFIIWSRILPDHIIITIAIQCVALCGSLLVPNVISSGLNRQVVDAGRRLFDYTWKTIRLRAESRRRSMGEAFTDQVQPLKKYFFDFYRPLTIRQKAIALDGCELKAVQLFSLLAYLADDPRLFLEHPVDYRIELAERGYAIYHCMRLYINPIPPILLHPTICDLGADDCPSNTTHNVKDEIKDGSGSGSGDESQQVDSDEIEDEDENEGDEEGDDDDGQDEDENEAESEYEDESEDDDDEEEEEEEEEEYEEDEHSKSISDAKLFNYFDSLARATVEYIRRARSTLYCSTQDCPNSIQSAGREFRRCTGCNVALYCSKKCQSEAWNAEQYPHKAICKVLQRMITVAGSKILFRHLECEHRGYPDELKTTVISKWWAGDVTMADLVQIESWSSYTRLPSPDMFKADILPGFEDYDAKVRDLSERDPLNLKAQYLTLENLASDETLNDMKAAFEKMHTWSKIVSGEADDCTCPNHKTTHRISQ
ncbi:hypothetical protein BDN70DRAFT_877911 [Pholiota conissans]|uniref:MYND-type domain-containing protein n=1 Tax=Pholiota conissans TaxID=109636 RepID=A0A9P5Z2Y5_9AGAR|nr:hypothetical protein BDN70DRAFT_877911 [Pholiota conissans]